ncbi:uncharacterized protein METZ01_LOCUS299890 [marine metagenome]|uniref:Uncharacterized protein n=1 Tax=marine metagenome TaxID=408172 RepID=A0A382ME26_9ZZZZ
MCTLLEESDMYRPIWIIKILLIFVFSTQLFSISLAEGQVTVEREGDENPVVVVAKSTFWGGIAGITTGLAIGLVVKDYEVMRYTIAAGTLVGMYYGWRHVNSRPESLPVFEFKSNGSVHFSLPRLRIHIDRPPAFVSRLARTGSSARAYVNLVGMVF